jgi:hypothetical protein
MGNKKITHRPFPPPSRGSLESQRTQSLFILLFSVERTENNKQQALRAFKAGKHRVAIDFFLLPSSQRQKKSIFSLRTLRLCGEKGKRNQIT